MSSEQAYAAWFESLSDPSERYSLEEIVYTDRNGGLLQVTHDMEALKQRSAEDWKALFEQRARRTVWPFCTLMNSNAMPISESVRL